ncbi:MAG: zf-HC2 domain-containing protein [Vicinamibacterales bacterium]|jgi:anti-sigma factor RsiW|nr:zf-HC2 domain-containing protein [Vicinamibacterales bacterium]
MSCDDFLERASDYVDGTLDAQARAAAEGHLASCEACRALAADLRRVRQTAGAIDRLPPPAGAWSRIAARLEADPEFARAASAAREARPPAAWQSWAWLATAAALVLAVSVSLVYLTRQPAPAAPQAATPGANASAADLVQSIESELALAATHYERAIASLEQVAQASDSPLDPEVTATLRKNLDLIDRAIDDSRTALEAEPDSRVAQESLFDAFRKKVALLQDTIALMNELRKGDADGAARVVEGLTKS